MDINTLRGIATLLVMISFIGVCVWAYSRKRKTEFDEAANLPFADEEDDNDDNDRDPDKGKGRKT